MAQPPFPDRLKTKEASAIFVGYFPDLAMDERTMQIPSYAKETKFQFMQYFYPSEQMVVRSNNFERLFNRPERDEPYFVDMEDIDRYCEELRSDSSHTEDRPTVSECEFLDPSIGPQFMHQEYYLDRIMERTRFRPTFTKAKKRLLLSLSRIIINGNEDDNMYMRKRNKRIQLIREFCKELKRKRFARVYKRYSKIRNEHQMPTVDKAQYLLDAEMKDKGLLKYKLYPNQPKAYVEFLNNRIEAIVKKFTAFADNPIYRKIYTDRVFYNTNINRSFIETYDNLPENEAVSELPMRLDLDRIRDPDGEIYVKPMSPLKEKAYPTTSTPFPININSHRNGPIEDDHIATSDEEFMSEYDDSPSTPGWSRPITTNKADFLIKLKEIQALPARDRQMERQLLIHDYSERARFRRNYKAYERLVNVLRQELPSVSLESQTLQAQELMDKQLDRTFYYDVNEPAAYTELLQKRQRAIQRKYTEYAESQEFRERYNQRVLGFKSKMEMHSPV